MQPVNHDKIENFYDVLNESTTLIVEQLKLSYFDALIKSSRYLLDGDVVSDDLNEDTIFTLKKLYQQLEDKAFHQEEIRKAFQLCLLTGFKHQKIGLSTMTPDSIGVLIAYLVDQLYPSNTQVDLLDATVGTGNLMMTILNHSKAQFGSLYGVDMNYQHLEMTLTLAQLTDHQVELVHQDSRNELIVPQSNLIVADLPTGYEKKNHELELPYQIVNNLMMYNAPGGYFIYLIPNDFFERVGQEEMKESILSNTYIQALISLPESMFKTVYAQKSILILKKRGENPEPVKEILVLSFPSFKDQTAVKKAMDQLNDWFKQNM